jgi:hypothetical protein
MTNNDLQSYAALNSKRKPVTGANVNGSVSRAICAQRRQ